MDNYMRLTDLYLGQTATIHIYSFPHFILETFLTCVICLIYIFLHFEVNKICKELLRWKPYMVIPTQITVKQNPSTESLSASLTTHYCELFKSTGEPSTTVAFRKLTKNFSTHSQNGWVMPIRPIATSKAANQESKDLYDKLPYITPEQFVKIDKERKIREKKFDNYMASLSTLCQNVIKKKYSQNTLTKQVEMTKEHLQCSKIAGDGKYLQCRTEAMTESLFNMLEGLITNSSLQNPMPFKGDITTFALDISDLSKRPTNFLLNKEIENWESNSTTRLSDISMTTTETLNSFKDEGPWPVEDGIKWQKIAL